MLCSCVVQCVSSCTERQCGLNKVVTKGITAPLEVFYTGDFLPSRIPWAGLKFVSEHRVSLSGPDSPSQALWWCACIKKTGAGSLMVPGFCHCNRRLCVQARSGAGACAAPGTCAWANLCASTWAKSSPPRKRCAFSGSSICASLAPASAAKGHTYARMGTFDRYSLVAVPGASPTTILKRWFSSLYMMAHVGAALLREPRLRLDPTRLVRLQHCN